MASIHSLARLLLLSVMSITTSVLANYKQSTYELQIEKPSFIKDTLARSLLGIEAHEKLPTFFKFPYLKAQSTKPKKKRTRFPSPQRPKPKRTRLPSPQRPLVKQLEMVDKTQQYNPKDLSMLTIFGQHMFPPPSIESINLADRQKINKAYRPSHEKPEFNEQPLLVKKLQKEKTLHYNPKDLSTLTTVGPTMFPPPSIESITPTDPQKIN